MIYDQSINSKNVHYKVLRKKLPVLFQDISIFKYDEHKNFRKNTNDNFSFLVGQHFIPLLITEFVAAQHQLPIVFFGGEKSVPVALMGICEGNNVFVNQDGSPNGTFYLPLHAQLYPFVLGEDPQGSQLLCFDPAANVIGEFDTGEAFYEDGKATELLRSTVEMAAVYNYTAKLTLKFMDQLSKHGLLKDGCLNIDAGRDGSFDIKGFKIVDQEKLQQLPGEILEELNGQGFLSQIFLHLASLKRVDDIFARQADAGCNFFDLAGVGEDSSNGN